MTGKNAIIEYAREVYESCEKRAKIPEVIAKVKERFWIVVSRKFVRYWCEEKMESISKDVDDSLKRLDEAIEKKNSYEVEWESVIFHVNKKAPDGTEFVEKYTIPFEELESIWYDYSQHGRNLSAKNLLSEHWLKRETLSLLRSRLWLTKDDNAIPQVVLDFMLEKYWEEEVEKKIYEVTHRAYEDKFKRKFVQADKRETDKLVRLWLEFKERLRLIRESLETFEPADVEFVPRKPWNWREKTFFLTDIHIGKIWTDKVIERLDAAFQEMARSEETKIHVVFWWDLWETFAQDWMHPWQLAYWTEQKWWYGYDLAVRISEILEKFFIWLYSQWKDVTVSWILWNHGRFSSKNEWDIKRSAELVIYEFLRLRLSKIEIDVRAFMEKINVIDSWKIRLVVAHWDWNFDKQKPEQVLLPRYRDWAYHVIASWDKHHLQSTEWYNYTWIKSPALAGKWQYDTDNNYHSTPGYVVIKENGFWTADIEIKRLPS